MYAYTVWTEGGGEGKTTLTAALAKAHERAGYDVLAVDMDGQKGGLSSHFGLLGEENNETDQGNNILDFICRDGTENDNIRNLIRTREGIDILPSTRYLRDFDEALYRVGHPAARDRPDEQLRHIITEQYHLYEDYDIMVVDVPKDVGKATRNGMYATRNVLIPTPLTRKAELSMNGIVENILGFEKRKGIDVGIVGMVPNKVESQERINIKEARRGLSEALVQYEYENDRKIPLAPVEVPDKEDLFDHAWRKEMSVFRFVEEEVKPYVYPTDEETLDMLEDLAAYVVWHLSGGDEGYNVEREQPFMEYLNGIEGPATTEEIEKWAEEKYATDGGEADNEEDD